MLRGAKWGKEECGYGRSRTSPRTGPARPDRDHENEQNENRAAPLRVHASARSMMRICSRHSPMTYRCWPNGFLSFSKTNLYIQLSDTGRRFTWPSSRHTNHSPLRPFYSTILSSVSWPCLRLNIQLDGILIVSWIAQMTKKNELLETKRWCLEIARDDCFFLCFTCLFSFFFTRLLLLSLIILILLMCIKI